METRLEKYKEYREEIKSSTDEKALVNKYFKVEKENKPLKEKKKNVKKQKITTLGQVYRKKAIIRQILFVFGIIFVSVLLILIIVFLVGGFNGK